jgi:hypothetical protein
MRNHTDVIDLLATSRPAYFDDPGDLRRRRADLERAISAPLPQGFSSAPVARTGFLRRSHPLTIGIAAAATIVAVTAGSMVVSSKKDQKGSVASGGTAVASAPKGKYLLVTSESHDLAPAKVNGKTIKVDSMTKDQEWIPRHSEDASYSASTSRQVMADPEATQAWKSAGSPTKILMGNAVGKNDTKLTYTMRPLDNASGTEVGVNHTTSTEAGCGTLDQCARFPATEKGAVQRFNTLAAAAAKWDLQTRKSLETDGVPENNNRPAKPATEDEKAAIVARATYRIAEGLLNSPISPAARVAILGELDRIAGITKIGPVKDQKGRTGVGFTTITNDEESRMIVDTKTGQLLASELRKTKPGGLDSWLKPTDIYQSTVYLGMKWTNANPPKPNIKHPDGTE